MSKNLRTVESSTRLDAEQKQHENLSAPKDEHMCTPAAHSTPLAYGTHLMWWCTPSGQNESTVRRGGWTENVYASRKFEAPTVPGSESRRVERKVLTQKPDEVEDTSQ